MIIGKDLTVHPFAVPKDMSIIPNWVLWRKEQRNGRTTKVPYSAFNFSNDRAVHASSTDPTSWADFGTAFKIWEHFPDFISGIGFVFSEDAGLTFLDLDHCIREDGTLSDVATDVIKTIGACAFYEISQSGTGIHCFVRGSVPRCFKNSKIGVECYDSKRFCAFTGIELTEGNGGHRDFLPDNELNLLKVWARYKTQDRPTQPIAHREAVSSLSDQEIIQKCMNGKSGELFRRLYGGDFKGLYQSQSEADLCLCGLIAFWADRDPGTIDRIYRSSQLMRGKWNRPDYRCRTIERACAGCRESLSEYTARRAREERHKYEQHFLSE